MIAVGYMDPGNWATGIEAGSRYGYALLWVILLSNLMAMVLQHLCVRLGITSQMDLAESCRERCPRWLNLMLYAFAEIAMISTDLAEVIGTAIALRLLFGLPIIVGVLVTVADVLLLLAGLGSDQTKSYRILEVLVMVLMSIIGACFLIEMVFVKPSLSGILWGFVPHELGLLADKDALFAAIGIIGATVMPHNLYLHSSIVKHRLSHPKERGDDSEADHEVIAIMPDNTDGLGKMINFATADTIVALFLALLVNAAILITSAAAFHSRGQHNVQHIEEAALLMRQWMGPAASIVFGLALLAAGQSSTVTGTIAGQIVFEGFLRIKLKPWLRRLVTRVVAIAPALIIVLIMGEDRINWLLLVSQVVLSFQLPFAIVPLIIFAFNPPVNRAGQSSELAEYWQSRKGRLSEKILKLTSWAITVFILILNVLLVITMLI